MILVMNNMMMPPYNPYNLNYYNTHISNNNFKTQGLLFN